MRLRLVNEPDHEQTENLRALCLCVLEPLRNALMREAKKEVPIVINSGFRSLSLNERIGGSKRSQHSQGEAADIIVDGFSALEICQILKNSGIPFDQAIHEFESWSHISYKRKGENRFQALTINHQGTFLGLKGSENV